MDISRVDIIGSRLPGREAGVQLTRVVRTFGTVRALDGVDLVAPAARVSALVGPAGCGTSTLLRVAAGLLPPDSGRIRVAGVDVVADPHTARAVLGWLSQGVGTWEQARVDDVLGALAAAHGRPGAAARISRACALAGLRGTTRRRVGDLSVLDRRRLGLAQALLSDPPVLLLDAPLGGLVGEDRDRLAETLLAVAGGRTVLLSAHGLAEVDGVADRVLTMEAGRVVAGRDLATGPPVRAWRVLARDGQHLHAVLAAHAVPFTQTTSPAEEDDGHVAIEVLIGDGPAADDEASALLALLVRERTDVLAFGPTGSRGSPASDIPGGSR